jgi:phosphopantothenoylcysteine decarboxylase / phosphopantothenate---cysteine ligase
MWKDKHVLLGISGGIAAYKVPELIRTFIKAGAEVKVIATKNALEFVTPLTLETLSKNKLYSETFDSGNRYSTEHISHADWADIFVVAPATANIIGKFAMGIADDALSTTFLAFNKLVFVAPAMNCNMYDNHVVRENIDKLKSAGVDFIEPVEGELACGTFGKGRMEEPKAIFEYISTRLELQSSWKGKRMLITAGPTYEKIDPVRFIGNYSSGKMGFAIAEACAKRGAEVILIAGPVDLKSLNPGIKRIDVESASQMYDEAVGIFPEMDAAILCAAVADFTPVITSENKTKRGEDDIILRLKPTKDIAAALGSTKKKSQILVGFALETENEEENAISKLDRKNLDFIVLNSLHDEGAGFRHDTNKIKIINREGYRFDFPLKNKNEVAEDILDALNIYFVNNK